MNIATTQASGLQHLIAPPVSHDIEVMRLTRAADALRAIREDVRAMTDALAHLDEPADPFEYISKASHEQCRELVLALKNRIAELDCDTCHLEDAACQLSSEIEAQALADNPPLCANCNGSGEGQYDGLTCRSCRGTGIERYEE